MEPLARVLRSEGFTTLNIPYPSTRLPIPALADHVRREVGKIADGGPVHFITHSLGGIVARLMMAGPLPCSPGRMVMLAPPNGGSEIVDWSSGKPLVQLLLGPAGRELSSTGLPSALPALPMGLEAAVIMGNRSSIPLFRKLLEQDNDGIVSASRGKIDGLRGFSVIDADHTFIQVHPEAIRLCVGFLKTGSWDA
jgi:triacylglycerol lipase